MSLITMVVTIGLVMTTLGIAIHVHQDARAVSARHPIFQVVYYIWNFIIEASFVGLKLVLRLLIVALKMILRAPFVMLKIGIRVSNILTELLTMVTDLLVEAYNAFKR